MLKIIQIRNIIFERHRERVQNLLLKCTGANHQSMLWKVILIYVCRFELREQNDMNAGIQCWTYTILTNQSQSAFDLVTSAKNEHWEVFTLNCFKTTYLHISSGFVRSSRSRIGVQILLLVEKWRRVAL